MTSLRTAPAQTGTRPSPLRRILVLTTALLLAIAFAWAYMGNTSSASAAITMPVVEQCNGQFSGGGQGASCSVVVNNYLDIAAGTQSSSVVVTACNGSEGVPTASCSSESSTFPSLITGVNQCNGSADGGGSRLICSVSVINNITGEATPTPASIRQCNDATSALVCSPIGNTTDATIEQCNNSTAADGIGSVLTCTVLTSTQTTALPVSIDQCNYSGNGNGSFVTCTASIQNIVVPAEVEEPEPEPTDEPTATPTPTTPPSETPTTPPSETPTTPPTAPETVTPTPSDTPTPVSSTPGGGGGNGGGYDEGTLAATGPESVATLGLGALVLLFAGSLVLLSHNIHRKPASIRENNRVIR
jgi:hypothetical protein